MLVEVSQQSEAPIGGDAVVEEHLHSRADDEVADQQRYRHGCCECLNVRAQQIIRSGEQQCHDGGCNGRGHANAQHSGCHATCEPEETPIDQMSFQKRDQRRADVHAREERDAEDERIVSVGLIQKVGTRLLDAVRSGHERDGTTDHEQSVERRAVRARRCGH